MKDLQSLIIAAQGGDATAYGEIVLRFQDMAVGYAYAMLGDFHRAEDAAQEAFIETYQRLPNLREPAAFSRWFRQIVFKHCDRITRRKRPEVAQLLDMADSETKISAEVEESEMRDAILKAIAGLTGNERAVTTLFYINGYSHQDVAEFLDVSVPVVKSRLHRARQKLKGRMISMVGEALKEHAPDDSFAQRVAKAVEIYTAKGPPENSMWSDWWHQLRDQWLEIRQGEEGFQINVALSKHEDPRVRAKAALHFGILGDPRGNEHCLRLASDPVPSVRKSALWSFARLIHPTPPSWGYGAPADHVPEEIERVLPFFNDARLRRLVVAILSDYVGLGDIRIEGTLRQALDDPKHGIRHSAACALRVACPGCGTVPERWQDKREKSMPVVDSEWERKARRRAAERLVPGMEGLEKDLAIAASPAEGDRRRAAMNLSLRPESAAEGALLGLLKDSSANVRRDAARAYAVRIDPARHESDSPAPSRVPEGIAHLLPMLKDPNPKNRRVAVALIGRYAGMGDPQIDEALKRAAREMALFSPFSGTRPIGPDTKPPAS